MAHQFKLMDLTQAGRVIQVLRLSNGHWHCELCGPVSTHLCPHAALCEQSRWSVAEHRLIPEHKGPGSSNHKDVSEHV